MAVLATPADDRATPSALRPVFAALRIGLHLLVVGLTLFVVVRAVLGDRASELPIVVLAVALLAWYGAGIAVAHRRMGIAARTVWRVGLLGLWAALAALSPDAAYLAFPLFFLELHALPARAGIPFVAVTFVLSVWSTTTHLGLQPGSVLGPLIGAAVAVVIGLGYRAMARETRERQQLILDLIATREELAAASRAAGTAAERERLAREIHDTVAQGLSSIQMLLHAAERDVADERTRSRLALARETAAENLHETRRFIRELAPAPLAVDALPAALARVVETANAQAREAGRATRVSLSVSGDPIALPTAVEATLLRVAQGSIANVAAHAGAARAELTLTYLGDEVALDVVDDGVGFDPDAVGRAEPASTTGFGLQAVRRRVQTHGGRVDLESAPGEGTAVSVRIPVVTP